MEGDLSDPAGGNADHDGAPDVGGELALSVDATGQVGQMPPSVTENASDTAVIGPTAVCNSRYRIEGARRMLAKALQAEVDAYVARFADERDADGRRLVVRNGSRRSREVLTSAGAVEVTAPRVNDKRVDPATGEQMRFSSAILPPWARKTPKITEVLPLLYLHGLSSGDFVPGWASSSARRRACRWR